MDMITVMITAMPMIMHMTMGMIISIIMITALIMNTNRKMKIISTTMMRISITLIRMNQTHRARRKTLETPLRKTKLIFQRLWKMSISEQPLFTSLVTSFKVLAFSLQQSLFSSIQLGTSLILYARFCFQSSCSSQQSQYREIASLF